eukprot:sb/3463526/
MALFRPAVALPVRGRCIRRALSSETEKPVAILFPGQGAQYVGMPRKYLDIPGAREIFKTARSVLGYDLLKLCLEGPEKILKLTYYCQPAVLCTSLAALEWLKAEQPEVLKRCVATAGFSVGELTALAFSGALTVEDAFSIVRVRAKAMHDASHSPPSGMLTVIGLPPQEYWTLLDPLHPIFAGRIIGSRSVENKTRSFYYTTVGPRFTGTPIYREDNYKLPPISRISGISPRYTGHPDLPGKTLSPSIPGFDLRLRCKDCLIIPEPYYLETSPTYRDRAKDVRNTVEPFIFFQIINFLKKSPSFYYTTVGPRFTGTPIYREDNYKHNGKIETEKSGRDRERGRERVRERVSYRGEGERPFYYTTVGPRFTGTPIYREDKLPPISSISGISPRYTGHPDLPGKTLSPSIPGFDCEKKPDRLRDPLMRSISLPLSVSVSIHLSVDRQLSFSLPLSFPLSLSLPLSIFSVYPSVSPFIEMRDRGRDRDREYRQRQRRAAVNGLPNTQIVTAPNTAGSNEKTKNRRHSDKEHDCAGVPKTNRETTIRHRGGVSDNKRTTRSVTE